MNEKDSAFKYFDLYISEGTKERSEIIDMVKELWTVDTETARKILNKQINIYTKTKIYPAFEVISIANMFVDIDMKEAIKYYENLETKPDYIKYLLSELYSETEKEKSNQYKKSALKSGTNEKDLQTEIAENLKKLSPKTAVSYYLRTLDKVSTSKINLSGFGMNEVPIVIAEFKKLEELDLSENNFKELPKEITGLKSLKLLNINGNQISYDIAKYQIKPKMPSCKILISKWYSSDGYSQEMENGDL